MGYSGDSLIVLLTFGLFKRASLSILESPMESIRNVDRYLSPAQFFKCFCIQHQKEGTLVLEDNFSLASHIPNFWIAKKQYFKPIRSMSFYTWFGVMTTDRMTPSSSSYSTRWWNKDRFWGIRSCMFPHLSYRWNISSVDNIKFTNTISTCINLILLTNLICLPWRSILMRESPTRCLKPHA